MAEQQRQERSLNTNRGFRVRRSITELQDEYDKGNEKPLVDLMRAWKGIKDLPPTDPRSFFALGGLHGEPFRGAGWGNSAWWGGYCNHGNVLFPTWHRVYLLKLENALRTIPDCEDVTLPFWDEASEDSIQHGIPWALTKKKIERKNGPAIENPLRSFVFNEEITDFINGDNPNYSKPKGYETVRYPLSGLVGTDADRAATKKHNALYPDYDTNVRLLNENVIEWLTSFIVVNDKKIPTNVKEKYINCLKAPNYTVFSNTTSAAQWNANQESGVPPVVPLESPHNDMHLAVGGFDTPSFDVSPICGANGDMGENDTAGLDPIFFFHHCFVDRVFWLWQQKQGCTDHLDVLPEYPGTNSVDNQGPTPGVAGGTWLNLDSPLSPFKRDDGSTYTSNQAVNIEEQLGYTYGHGSLEDQIEPGPLAAANTDGFPTTRTIKVTGLNRAAIRGSFLIGTFLKIDEKRYHVGNESVLSRWSIQGCANCQTHLEVKAFVGLHGLADEDLTDADYEVEVRTRDGVLHEHRAIVSLFHKKAFHVQLK